MNSPRGGLKMSNIPTAKFSDVESRVRFGVGYANAINQMNRDQSGVAVAPVFNTAAVERRIRKQHAKFYGLDSKYDGKGNLRSLPY